MFWRRRKSTPQWIVVVSQIRPFDHYGPARDELAWPEQRRSEQALDSRDAADELANKLRWRDEVQAGRNRVKVVFSGR